MYLPEIVGCYEIPQQLWDSETGLRGINLSADMTAPRALCLLFRVQTYVIGDILTLKVTTKALVECLHLYTILR